MKAHLTRVYAEIGVTDRTQAALWARSHGITAENETTPAEPGSSRSPFRVRLTGGSGRAPHLWW